MIENVICVLILGGYLVYKHTCLMGNHELIPYKKDAMCRKCGIIVKTSRHR